MRPPRRNLLGAAAALVSASALAQGTAREGAPRAAAPDEGRILEVLAEVYRKNRYLSVPEEDGRLLRVLAESIGARHVVELGTSTGYSGLWMLLALLRTGGRLATYEIDRGRLDSARAAFEKAGVLARATLVLGDAHAELRRSVEPVDMAFLDADKDGYLDYLRTLMPRVRAGGLIIAHNMASPAPDPRYVQAVTRDPALETVFVHMHAAGIGITLKKRA